MAISDLIPWKKSQIPVKRESERLPEARSTGSAIDLWQQQVDRLLDEFWGRWGLTAPRWFDQPWTSFSPNLDVVEDDRQLQVSVELPGLDEKDFEVSLSHHQLIISGQKKEEKEQKGKNYYRMERSYGSFQRTVPLPDGVDESNVQATFKQGVLTVTLPKTQVVEERKKITVKTK